MNDKRRGAEGVFGALNHSVNPMHSNLHVTDRKSSLLNREKRELFKLLLGTTRNKNKGNYLLSIVFFHLLFSVPFFVGII